MDRTRSSLLLRIRDVRDDDSWREFHALYHPILQAYVRRAGLNDADADDVVQIIFERLLAMMPAFELDRERGRFRTWLWRVMHNAVVDFQRGRGRRQRAELAVRPLQEPTAPPDEPDGWRDDLRRRVLQFSLDAVRAKTQQQTWAAFQGHILEGRPSAVVAQELGITANLVNVNSSRVVARIKERCREYLEDLDDDVEIQL
jgi:RNA polymerase sigma factor (sigma-70 family)